jgi:DNA-binding transcriptional ArsR family regulator
MDETRIQDNIEAIISTNEFRVIQVLKDLERMKRNIRFGNERDILRLLSDELYRVEIAVEMSSSNEEASIMLGMSDRTFYRKLQQVKLRKSGVITLKEEQE